ncbi:MAG TPA: adenosine kinase [Pelagibacterium sp.]|jgi:sugar/nucleoside kinase (ribokinase family)|uniref:adenosine kinase n=1 Tax=uncultured Pelagibacterium sp. TaxID=1159875 RepID=UPI000C670109|nr:adenosine kinase [Pelagibacterium sp.]HCO55425.1 adenosine kinase [Pelagibacterium sp.]|tara:strand:- start:4827 stop:5828 length:1002 start_codon:yes stop_codon:yes gene_type:complete
MTTRFDVLTIGNAIVDVIAPIDDKFLVDESLRKSIMHLVDADRSADLYAKMPETKSIIPGGSSANTAAGVAALGGRAAFVGKVAEDELGLVFRDDFDTKGIHYETAYLRDDVATARSMILVTPDGERTMNTYLGACQHLTEDDIVEETVGASAITYMEGYLWDPPQAKKAFIMAAHYAHKNERAAAITLSDPFCVNRFRNEFLDLIKSKTMDYVFANIEEVKALYETDDLNVAVRQLAEDAEIAAVTMGARGAMAIKNGEIVSVPAFPVSNVVDVTGAGDLFASGFLLATARGQSMEEALKLGCLAASEVISHYGARPVADLKALARGEGIAV